MTTDHKHPQIKWAETNDAVFLTILVSDCVSPEIKIGEDNVSFACKTADGDYSCDLKLKGKVDLEDKNTQYTVTGRDIQIHLVKAGDDSERWNSLLADKKLGKNLVKPDFDKWVDSDDEAAEADGFDTSQFGGAGGMGGGMPGMGGMGGGMPGMGGMGGGMPGMGGMGGGMPGMGGAGGMGGMDMAKMMEMMQGMKGGMPGMGADGDVADEDDDEDDLPDLEDTEVVN